MRQPFKMIGIHGYKAADATYDLREPLLLTGANGSGKSTVLEAIRFALTGEVPSGKSNDRIASYFGPQGGSVTLADRGNEFIARHVRIDHESAKVSIECEESDGNPALDDCDPYVLRIADFLALSAEERRKYVLRVCSVDAPATKAVRDEIALRYVRAVAGPAARLDDLERRDLPPEEQSAIDCWNDGGASIAAWLDLRVRKPDVQLAQLFADLVRESREETLRLGGAYRDATAALRALEQQARSIEGAAGTVQARTVALRDAQAKLREVEKAHNLARAALDQRRRASARFDAASDVLVELRANLATIAEPGPEPVPPERDHELDRLQEKLRGIEAAISTLEHRRAQGLAALEKFRFLVDQRKYTEEQLARSSESPAAEALRLMHGIPDEAHPDIFRLRALVQRVCVDADTDIRDLSERLARQAVEEAQARSAIEGAANPAALEAERDAQRAEAERIKGEIARRRQPAGNFAKQREVWASAKSRLDSAKQSVSNAEAELVAARAAIAELPPVPPEIETDLKAARAAAALAEERLSEANRATGELRAYDAAKKRSEKLREETAAWKILERVLADARESLVMDITKPLLDDVDKFLRAAHRDEVSFCDLENERGRPIFRFGWVSAAGKVAIETLSGGEQALLATALTLAIAVRSAGRRVLLVEADNLDSENLAHFLEAIYSFAGELDCVAVATWTLSGTGSMAPGWRVFDFGSEVRA